MTLNNRCLKSSARYNEVVETQYLLCNQSHADENHFEDSFCKSSRSEIFSVIYHYFPCLALRMHRYCSLLSWFCLQELLRNEEFLGFFFDFAASNLQRFSPPPSLIFHSEIIFKYPLKKQLQKFLQRATSCEKFGIGWENFQVFFKPGRKLLYNLFLLRLTRRWKTRSGNIKTEM